MDFFRCKIITENRWPLFEEGVPTPDILPGLCYAMMRGLREACKAPLLELFFDHDWDETAWARVRSFLYYCR